MRGLRHFYLAHLSKPKGDRVLYRFVRKQPPRSIVEIGLASLSRTERLLKMAGERLGQRPRYAAIDLFDMRSDSPLPLKQTFKQLRPLTDKLRLVPGDANVVLHAAANDLLGTDLLLFTAEAFAKLSPSAWFFVPRILKDGPAGEHGDKKRAQNIDVTRIFVAERTAEGEIAHRAVAVEEIKRLANGAGQRKAA